MNYECDRKGTALNYHVLSDTVSEVRRAVRPMEMQFAMNACIYNA